LSSITSATNSSIPRPPQRPRAARAGASRSRALKLVRDGKRDLGVRAHRAGERSSRGNDAVAHDTDQRAALGPIRCQHRLDRLGADRRMAVKTPIEALVGETAEEGEQLVGIVSTRRSEAHGRAVAQDDVGVLGHSENGVHSQECR
jgi:hypothetical protein